MPPLPKADSPRVIFHLQVAYDHQVKGSGPRGTPCVEAYCPFGGLESLYQFLTTGGFVRRIEPSALIFAALVLLTRFVEPRFQRLDLPVRVFRSGSTCLANNYSRSASPLFPQVRLRLANGNLISIRAPAASAVTPFVQGLKLNEVDYTSPWISWGDIAGGGDIDFVLSPVPNPAWGSRNEAAAPSFDSNGLD